MYSRHIIRAAHNWTKIVAAIYWYKIQRTEFYINCTFDFSVHQQHHINEWLRWSLLVKWVTDFIFWIASPVKFGEHYPLSNKDLSNPRSLPRTDAISHRLMEVTSLLMLVLMEIWERRRPRARSLSIKPMVDPPGAVCSLLLWWHVTMTTGSPGSKLCVSS